MSGYKELVESWDLVESKTGVVGKRAFYKSATGTASLPELDDSFSTNYQSCICRNIRHTKFFPDPTDRSEWVELLECDYNTNTGSTEDKEFDEEERRYSGGTEVISVENPDNWQWKLKGSALKQPLYLTNVIGSFTAQRKLTSDAAKETWLQDRFEAQVGTINQAKFDGHRIGSVLWDTISGGTQYDENGDKFWLFELVFSYRLIRSGPKVDVGGKPFPIDFLGNAITENDWWYAWNKNASAAGTGAWDIPTDADGAEMYSKSDFTLIFK